MNYGMIDDFGAVASEMGGRVGFFKTPDTPPDMLEPVIVRVIRDELDDPVTFILSRLDGLEWRLLLRDGDLPWLLEHPIEIDEEENG